MADNFLDNTKKFTQNSVDKFKKQKKGTKIAIIVSLVGILAAGTYVAIESQSNKYAILFSDLDNKDAATVTSELESQGVDMKIKGNSIYVPTEMVDKLRLEMSTNISGGSDGFELMDAGSSFGMTSEEFNLKKLRMLQGELEKTIKSFSQIDNARVHITQSEDSVFATNKTEGKAAVYIELKSGQSLTETQIRSIISLVSGSQKNIPKQNVEVMDQNMNLLSEDLYDENGETNKKTNSSTGNMEENQKSTKKFNSQLEKSALELLEPIYGEGKVNIKVNAILDFNAEEKTQIIVDPNSVILSETIKKDTVSESNGGNTSNSPVDNNMSNTTEETDDDKIVTSESIEETRNYEVGKTEIYTINAPGQVQRLTASVAIHGNLNETEIEQIKENVGNVIGLNADRGDSISVISKNFEEIINTEKDKQEELDEKDKLLKMSTLVLGGVSILGVIILVLILIMRKRDKKLEETEVEFSEINNLQERLDNLQNEDNENILKYISEDNERTLEDEVKIYAQEKPDQVKEIIKTWLNDEK